MSGPDFLLIGAMKCGTTTLAAQLAAQDGVFMTTPKEPNYFSDDEVFAKGPGWYAALFDGAAGSDLKGEASTHYTKLPTYTQTLSRMQAQLNAPRLIYMIRNPITRATSHYIHEWTMGNMGADAAQAFAEAPELVAYGCYGMQIMPFIEAYGPEAVFLTSLEQLKADGPGEFARITQHLGLSRAAWVEDMPAQNVSAERVRRLPFQDLLVDNPVAEVLRRTLVPKALRTWVRNSRKMSDRPEVPDSIETEMRMRFLEDRDVLARLFPGHAALDLCYPFA